jgi:hypothetical protein
MLETAQTGDELKNASFIPPFPQVGSSCPEIDNIRSIKSCNLNVLVGAKWNRKVLTTLPACPAFP